MVQDKSQEVGAKVKEAVQASRPKTGAMTDAGMASKPLSPIEVQDLTTVADTAAAGSHTANIEASPAIGEVSVVYMGGHPDHVDSVEGSLRLTEAGIEFPSTSILIPYEAVLDMSAIKGKLPNSYIQMLNAKAQQGKWVGFAAKVGASHFLGSKSASLVEQGVSKAVAGDGTPMQAPINRICVLVKLQETKYKVVFDALGDTPEAMEQSAHRFCNLSVKVRSRFGKQPVRKKDADTSEKPADMEPAQVTKVVACPKCKTKVRTRKPGIIACPKCQTKIRVSENFFGK